MVEAANKKVFLDTNKFAENRTIIYNGKTFTDIPVILAEVKEKDRRVAIIQGGRKDNTQGLFMAVATLRCALSDLDGRQPEKGQKIKINHQEGGGGYFSEYTIDASGCDMGMVKLELEAIDE